MNKIKKYFLALLLLELIFAYAPVYAQSTQTSTGYDYSNAGVSKQIETYLCSPNSTVGSNQVNQALTVNNSNPFFQCINQLYKFAIIIASVVGVFFIVIAGYVYMSAEGNNESVEKAKSILTSTIVSIVILLAGYVLLRALNPDLVQFSSIQPPNVTLQVNAPPTTSVPVTNTSPGGPVGTNAQGAATQLLSLNSSGKITISGSGSCPGNNPLVNIQAIAAGNPAQFDGPGSTCASGTTGIDPVMLNALVSVANGGLPITITSLTSGHHSSANDPHYAGEAVDLVPQNVQGNGQAILNALVQGGASKIAVECNLNGAAQFLVIYPAGVSDTSQCTSQPNYHWHAQWSGVGVLTPENN